MNFREFLELNEVLNEALKIIKKGSEVSDDDVIIGKFQGKNIIKTKHLKDIRDKETSGRGDGISNEEFISILKRLPITKKLENGYYNLVYKENEKYNMIIIFVDQISIRLITVLHQNRNYDNFKTKPGDTKLIIENIEIEVIELVEVSEL
jgi:hypothetical protein